MRSSPRILNLGHVAHIGAEVATQIFRCAKVDLATSEKIRQLQLDSREREEPRRSSWLEFDEQIDVAIGTIGTAQHGAKQR